MQPVIIDQDSGRELWTASQCASFSGTARGTFTSYAGRGRAPKPVAKHQGLTLWDSKDVKEWVEARAEAKARKTPDVKNAHNVESSAR